MPHKKEDKIFGHDGKETEFGTFVSSPHSPSRNPKTGVDLDQPDRPQSQKSEQRKDKDSKGSNTTDRP